MNLVDSSMNQRQLRLFDGLEKTDLSIGEVASYFKISTATVRNWIKTGYLRFNRQNRISKDSLEKFKNSVIGEEKLTSRANKSQRDCHNHTKLLEKFMALLLKENLNGFDLGEEYEYSLSNSYRNKEGIYYTPPNIVEKFFQYLPAKTQDLSFCDPCCGSGNFIIAAIKYGISPKNIYGYDTDPIAVELTKKRIVQSTGYKSRNIV